MKLALTGLEAYNSSFITSKEKTQIQNNFGQGAFIR